MALKRINHICINDLLNKLPRGKFEVDHFNRLCEVVNSTDEEGQAVVVRLVTTCHGMAADDVYNNALAKNNMREALNGITKEKHDKLFQKSMHLLFVC